jgi:hypothetical protein
MTAEAWAAWVQAGGSIVAIIAGFGTVIYQNRHSDRTQEAERGRRAEVVAYRLIGWIGEASIRINRSLTRCHEAQAEAAKERRLASNLIPRLGLGMAVSVEGVLPDLHYLLNGSGDIAQLDHLMQTYEAFLERAHAGTIHPDTGEGSMIAGPQMLEFLSRAETQLDALRTLQANAEGHLAPLVQKAIDGGR